MNLQQIFGKMYSQYSKIGEINNQIKQKLGIITINF